jgi:hypothetical protein
VFVQGKSFLSSLIFVGKPSSLPWSKIFEYLNDISLGQAPALPPNIRLGWKGLTETNTLAYFEHSALYSYGEVPLV